MLEDRRLAAIMFTDIVGYTELMGQNEDQAFLLLRKNREIQKPLIKKYRGQWLKEMGDGVLASFHSASDAVKCATEIQKSCKKEGIPLRIDIHEGEVVFEGGDVLGDGVNIASRLEEFAEEGAINISGAVYKEIKNKAGISAEFIEEKTLKGVEEPVKVYRICGKGKEIKNSEVESQNGKKNHKSYLLLGVFILIAVLLVWKYLPNSTTPVIEKSIAVLPFKNQSESEEYSYFGDALTDEIIMQLQKVRDFTVRSNTSVMKYKESDKSTPEIGSELNVNYVIEGAAQRDEDKVRIRVQLINTKTDEHVWGNTFDKEWSDILKLQGDIAKQIASELETVLTSNEIKELENQPTDNLEAYELYLKAKEFYYKGGVSNLNTAIYFYQQSLEKDPEFALPYIELGIIYNERTYWSDYFKESFGDTLIYFADKALSLNPDLAEGYLIRGQYYQQKGEYRKSDNQLKTSITLNPNYGDAFWLLSYNQFAEGQHINCIRYGEKARSLKFGDPDYPKLLNNLGYYYMFIIDFKRSETTFEEIISYNPLEGYNLLSGLASIMGDVEKLKVYTENICAIDSGRYCLSRLGIYNLYLQNYSEASKNFEESRELAIKEGDLLYFIREQHRYASALHKLNRINEAAQYFDAQIEYCKESIALNRSYAADGGAYYDLAAIHAFLGEKHQAYQVLHDMEDGIFQGWLARYMQVDPLYEKLWKDDEFKRIVKDQEMKYATVRAELDKMRAEGIL